MAISHYIEHRTGWSIKKFVRTARRHRTVYIKAGRQLVLDLVASMIYGVHFAEGHA